MRLVAIENGIGRGELSAVILGSWILGFESLTELIESNVEAIERNRSGKKFSFLFDF